MGPRRKDDANIGHVTCAGFLNLLSYHRLSILEEEYAKEIQGGTGCGDEGEGSAEKSAAGSRRVEGGHVGEGE